MDRYKRFDSAERVIQTGFWANLALMIAKLLAGHFGRSEAVFADGMESAADLIAILSSMIALRIGRHPYDVQHPYGHGKAESIAAVIVSLVIFGTGVWILGRSVLTLVRGEYTTPGGIAVAAAFLTILAKEALYRYSAAAGRALESPAITAVAKDHRKDAITSISTLAGVTGAFFGLTFLDPLAAGITSLFIFRIGYETFRGAAHDLMDGSPTDVCTDDIVRAAASVEGVISVHEIRCRRSGQYLIVDLKLDMDPEITVRKSHAIATEVKKQIFARFNNVGDVMIHVNPHQEKHEDLIRL